jgi:glycosyltransferase involved in cell wall biosynthesis
MTPRISVLVPCFNQGDFLLEALESVRAQTYRDFEIIVVDDGSTEPHTIEILSRLSGDDITVLRTENRGLPAARNVAAQRATGAFFCALDADDRLAPEWFERATAVLDARPDVAFVSHWLETFGDEHWTWRPERCDLEALLARNTVNGAALVRREAFESARGYDESMRTGCEDWDLWLRLVERGYQGAIVPEVLFHYRRREGSMSRVMLDEAAYRAPLQRLVEKHADGYRAHLVDVLAAKQVETLQLAAEIDRLERDALLVLQPSCRRAREEADAVAAKAGRARAIVEARARQEETAWRAGELEREVRELRSSWSWRITSPLRVLFAIATGRQRT